VDVIKLVYKFTFDVDAVANRGFTTKTSNLTFDRVKSNIPLQTEYHTHECNTYQIVYPQFLHSVADTD